MSAVFGQRADEVIAAGFPAQRRGQPLQHRDRGGAHRAAEPSGGLPVGPVGILDVGGFDPVAIQRAVFGFLVAAYADGLTLVQAHPGVLEEQHDGVPQPAGRGKSAVKTFDTDFNC